MKKNNLVNKEDEIIDSYYEEVSEEDLDDAIEEEIEEIIEEKVDEKLEERERKINKKIRKNKFRRIMNVIFTIIIIILMLIAIDVLLVSKCGIGPFLALPLKTYRDGGTKEYYGIGYKVIKYHQKQGRRDTVLGPWSIKYNTTPITTDDIDLAIEVNENEELAFNKYINEFVRINSTLLDINEEKREITLGYYDEGDKYSIEIICSVVKDNKKFKNLELGKSTTIIGNVVDYKERKKDTPTRFYVDNCFVEQ